MLKFENRIIETWRLFALHIVFFLCLSQMYFSFIVTQYGYQGYEDNFNVLKLWVAIFTIFISTIIVRRKGLPSNLFLHMVIALIVTPSMVLYYGSDLPNEFALLTVISFLLMAAVAGSVSLLPIRALQVGQKKLLVILTLVSVLFVVSIFAFGGGRFINFDISLVYDLRRDAAKNLPDIYSYLSPIFSKIIIPFGIVLALARCKWLLVCLLSFCSILIFALTANKAPLFYPFIIITIYLIAGKKGVVHLFLLLLILLVILSAVDFWLSMHTNNPLYGWFGSIFGRRALIVPSELNWRYFEYFSTNPYYYWSHSKISLGLVNQPYDLSPANLIGEVYLGSAEVSANTGWVGSGLANAGYVGVLIYSALIGLFFSFLDAYSKKLGGRLVISLLVLPVMTLITSTDLLTMLFTHGLVIAILLILIVKPHLAVQQGGATLCGSFEKRVG